MGGTRQILKERRARGIPPTVVLGEALLQLSFVCKNSRNIEHMLNSGPHAGVFVRSTK